MGAKGLRTAQSGRLWSRKPPRTAGKWMEFPWAATYKDHLILLLAPLQPPMNAANPYFLVSGFTNSRSGSWQMYPLCFNNAGSQ